MALLENKYTGKRLLLRSSHVFGRRQDIVDTCLSSPDISQMHASLRYDGARWVIVDHSKNGTWLNGSLLPTGVPRELTLNSEIRFGVEHTQSWQVLDLARPVASLLPLQPVGDPIALEGVHVLPDEDNPDQTLFATGQGHWLCESRNGVRTLMDGDILESDGRSWQFFMPGDYQLTRDAGLRRELTDQDLVFVFRVSLDEEHVAVKVLIRDNWFDLSERAHHYLLLTLARRRLQEQNLGYDEASQGWLELDELSRMLGQDPTHINIQIYRIRKQLQQLAGDVPALSQVVERRAGGMRFGFSRFRIVRGSTLEGETLAPGQLEELTT